MRCNLRHHAKTQTGCERKKKENKRKGRGYKTGKEEKKKNERGKQTGKEENKMDGSKENEKGNKRKIKSKGT